MTARPPAQLLDARAALLNDQESRLEAGRHDVFTRGGLGPTARRFYEALTRHGTDDDQVRNRAGMAPSRTLRGLSTSVRSGGEERAGPSFFIGGAGRVRAYASSPPPSPPGARTLRHRLRLLAQHHDWSLRSHALTPRLAVITTARYCLPDVTILRSWGLLDRLRNGTSLRLPVHRQQTPASHRDSG